MVWFAEGLPALDPAARAAIEARLVVAGKAVAPVHDADQRQTRGMTVDRTHSGVGGSAEVKTLLASLDDDGSRAVAMYAFRWPGARAGGRHGLRDLVMLLGRRRLGWTVEEVRWMLDQKVAFDSRSLPVLLAALEQLDDEALVSFSPALMSMFEDLGMQDMDGKSTVPVLTGRLIQLHRVHLLLRRVGLGADMPRWMLSRDWYGKRVRAELTEQLSAPGVMSLLTYCAALGREEPTKRWRATATALLVAVPGGMDLVRAMLDRFAEEVTGRAEIHNATEALVRGLIGLVAERREEWVSPVLAAISTSAATPPETRAPRARKAASLALANRGGG
jgi:hypothetical protein